MLWNLFLTSGEGRSSSPSPSGAKLTASLLDWSRSSPSKRTPDPAAIAEIESISRVSLSFLYSADIYYITRKYLSFNRQTITSQIGLFTEKYNLIGPVVTKIISFMWADIVLMEEKNTELSSKFYNNIFLFVDLTTLGTLIEFWLVVLLS